jgi:hypothetical protein
MPRMRDARVDSPLRDQHAAMLTAAHARRERENTGQMDAPSGMQCRRCVRMHERDRKRSSGESGRSASFLGTDQTRRRRVENEEIGDGFGLGCQQRKTGFGHRRRRRRGTKGAPLEGALLRRALLAGTLMARMLSMMGMVIVVLCVLRMTTLPAELRQPIGRKRRGTKFEGERPAGRRHEARWNERAQQERDKHEAREDSAFGSAEESCAHTGAHVTRFRPHRCPGRLQIQESPR